jgi:hypothetical protein
MKAHNITANSEGIKLVETYSCAAIAAPWIGLAMARMEAALAFIEFRGQWISLEM